MKRLLLLLLTAFSLTATPAQAGEFTIDESHVFATFTVSHLGIGTVVGRFNKVTGTVNLDQGHIDVVLYADSVDSGHPKRDQHLRSPDFFNAKQFPQITLKSKKVTKTGGNRYRVEAVISLLGKEKAIMIDLEKTGEGKDPWGGYRLGLAADFTVNRADFGMNYMPDGIGNAVKLQFYAEALRQ